MVVATGLLAVDLSIETETAAALDAANFDPGYIISDDYFYDGQAMTSGEIQTFLNGKIGTCLNGRCLNVAILPVTTRPASYSADTGGLVCSQIQGGSLRVSELIYRTQVACGISAKVILVTLQKEQGLVTNRAPGDWELRAAMGMGCPDTAPCDDAFAGLANQIISGTRQLHVYKVGQFGRQPGLNYIQYHPNAGCGGTTVNVRNYATAALYNYTPYQPNAAALANIGGTGDSCSSYGNRNFWAFYSNWFGSPTEIPCITNPTREIQRHWSDLGGADGSLGMPVSPGIVPGPRGVTVGHYQGGNIYCTPDIGPVVVSGDILTKYNSLGDAASALGGPTVAGSALSAGGVNGRIQYFQHGMMLSSAATGTHPVLDGSMRYAWGINGGSGGALGWPVGDPVTTAAALQQTFQRGSIAVQRSGEIVLLTGAIHSYWLAGSNASLLGAPTESAVPWSAGGVAGTLQYFERGMVLSSETTGTHAVLNGPIRNAWGPTGGSGGSLGWPIGEQESAAAGMRQQFQRGTLYASPSGVGGTLTGEISTYWSAGSNATRLGAPTASETPWSAGGVSGTLQYFERGMVLSSASTGTHAVLNGPMRNAWGPTGGSGGSLGWPIDDEKKTADGMVQQFQRGMLTISIPKVSGAIGTYWSSGSNASKLGYPVEAAVSWSAGGVSGTLQYFERGMVLSSASTGTYAVLNGPMRNAWGPTGGSGGSLGWPTGDQEATADGTRQQFQRGALYASPSGSGGTLSGVIRTYWSSGSNASKLGYPSGPASDWSAGGISGTLQYFDRGMVLSSASTGTFAVLNGPIRNAWGPTGGSGGSLGWPTADAQVVAGATRQQFQRGVISVQASGEAIVLSGPIGLYWSTGSNAAKLGYPTGSATPWSAGGVSGTLQYFDRGMVLSSTSTGTHAVLDGEFRNMWGLEGGSAGSMGWPTSDQEQLDRGMRQRFQGGTLTLLNDGTRVVLGGAIYQHWASGDRESVLGEALASAVPWTASGVTGSYQDFEGGMIMSSSTTGTFAVLHGPIRNVWGSQQGSRGPLGWPVADQVTDSSGTSQKFQNGTVIAPTTGDPYFVLD